MTCSRSLSLLCGLLLCLGGSCVHAPPPHPRALECTQLCAEYLSAGDLTRAEVQCDLGLQFAPQYSDLWVNKGLISLRREKFDEAKEHFIKALRFNQESAQAYNNLGYVYFQEHEYGKAHDNFQRALKVNPDYVEARYNLALDFRALKQSEKAKKELRTIVAVNPNLADPHYELGGLSLEEKDYDGAIAELQKAVELSPTFANAWQFLGQALSEAGRYGEAKDAYVSCLEADEKNIPCRNNVGLMNRKDQLTQPALKEAKEKLTAENTAPALYTLGRSYRERGLRNEEERAYRKCLKLDGRYAACHYALWEIYKDDRRDKDAATACKNFLKFAVVEEFPKEAEACEKYLSTNTF